MKTPELDQPTPEERRQALESLAAVLGRTVPPTPAAELAFLVDVARGTTGQSRSCRYLLFLLAGQTEPTGYEGVGLLELRALDQKLADVFLKILDWWRGPTQSDEPLFTLLGKLEDQFSTPAEASRQ